jgi:uncharacterized protein involved in cysteine biosynthesis
MTAKTWTWAWHPFLVYCLICFLAALLAGLIGLPGIVTLVLGVAVSLWAAARRWFENPVDER